MLSLRPIRRLCHSASAATGIASIPELNQIQPALVKLKAERDPEKLYELFKANATNRLVVENRFAFEDTVSRLAGACRFDYIEDLLEHQKTLPQGRREGFIVRIIMLYGKAGMTKHALDTFYNMHLYGCKRTVKSFNATLKVLTLNPDPVTIQEFLHDVPWKYGVQLDTFSFNIVIKAFCEMGVLDKAYLIMIEMEKSGLLPDVVTYTTLMSAFYKHNRYMIGNGLWNLMILKGVTPNLTSFNVRIQFLVNRRRAWEANDLLMLMPKLQIVPDEVTYNLVIKGFCLAGFPEMAKRVYSAMRGKGYKPNVKIYQTMIHYLCKGGEFDLAYTMCKDCMGKKWYPNMDTVRTLLEGLVKMGRCDKATLIMSLVRKRVPPISSKQLMSLQSVLSRD
ncbi:PREDICTED: pentatricopeptide repeat-containing protein At1g80150, mitochondrial-like [Tarenaya hassleriana]|uniref:pentatricopeptide repeat-containing protein At1g80150, mitochondrial-like n=1 Tax=Tarenaya hassleriana TaxID=28532 RepID=UPI00053CA2EF|nr:PREDICTED: pentatricopeptide repeat-containing protein At1g80150, mitochondrial-like [Tarenaya hassleriana]XP_010532167.1 PREDICTED: pentatricopeptide repeat-containing protein At1g80150, mitochondrial-like [Tarenaya hassleriana]XP_010532169.1 PREDICTED: pentatricopeptide repeat-containing protein At1g80150, mitochondrial-like [Tarenaya hassleriana]